MNSNEAYLKKGKKVTDFLTWYFIAPILLIIYIIVNPISICIVSLVISVLFFLLIFKSLKRWKSLLVVCLLLYTFLLSIYSFSPYLQYQEFRISHWNWEKTNGNPEKYFAKWEEIYRRKNPKAIADIQYSFHYKNELKQVTEFDAIKLVYPWFFGKTDAKKEELVHSLSQHINEYIKNKDFKILVNPKNGDSKLFFTTEKVFFANSGVYDLIMSVAQVFLFIAVLIGIGWLIVRYFLKDK